jgi:hypothetical protein
MIMSLEDRTPLPQKAISLSNKSPNAFEGIRHYGPTVRTEAIAAILNQITGYSFGGIYNGATEEQRRAEIDGWRIYYDALKAGNVTLPRP